MAGLVGLVWNQEKDEGTVVGVGKGLHGSEIDQFGWKSLLRTIKERLMIVRLTAVQNFEQIHSDKLMVILTHTLEADDFK